MAVRVDRWLRLGLLLSAATPSLALAASFEVMPVTVELRSDIRAATIELVNRESDAVAVQVRTFVWQQAANDDKLTPTTDISVSPPIFTIGGGKRQVIRVLLRQLPGDSETNYRLLLDEIPGSRIGIGVHFALRISIPIFGEPDIPIAPILQPSIQHRSGELVLVAANTGKQRIRLINPVLTIQNGTKLKLSAPPNPYILPGVERLWTITDPPEQSMGPAAHLTAMTDHGPIDVPVPVTP